MTQSSQTVRWFSRRPILSSEDQVETRIRIILYCEVFELLGNNAVPREEIIARLRFPGIHDVVQERAGIENMLDSALDKGLLLEVGPLQITSVTPLGLLYTQAMGLQEQREWKVAEQMVLDLFFQKPRRVGELDALFRALAHDLWPSGYEEHAYWLLRGTFFRVTLKGPTVEETGDLVSITPVGRQVVRQFRCNDFYPAHPLLEARTLGTATPRANADSSPKREVAQLSAGSQSLDEDYRG